mgnify:CR=1 FL=1
MTPDRPKVAGADLDAQTDDLYRARLEHVRSHLARAAADALLICDPNDIFYVTGAMNMQIFCARTPARYLLVVDGGPTILFEYRGCEHLAEGLSTIDEIRLGVGLDIVSSGGDVAAASKELAGEIGAELRHYGARRLAVDRFPFSATDELRAADLTLVSADTILAPARAIKLPIEIPYLREAMRRVEVAVEALEEASEPGMTENEAWAHFHFELMAKDGQHTVTRLFQSGPNTYPYFQEAGQRKLGNGELLALDTDANGYENYCVDFSRTFLCGDAAATPEQRLLYGRAKEQLEWNTSILGPGIEFAELARRAWTVPEEHQASRYYCVGHGLGMSGEWPNIPHYEPGSPYPLNGCIEAGMIICLESYVGSSESGQGVKLEDQFLILADGVERMSTYPFDERLSS